MIPIGILTAASTSSFSFLLDQYPGAAAAYSLRKLRSAYTGAAIRVQRSLDNNEFDVGFNVNGELDTTFLLLSCAGTNGFIVKWYDQSGNLADIIGGTSRPQIVVSGVLQTQNGKPAIIETNSFPNLQYLITPFSFNLAANKLASIYSVTKANTITSGIYYAMRRFNCADYTSGIGSFASDGGNLNRMPLGRGGTGSLSDNRTFDFYFNPTIQQLTSSYASTTNVSIYKNNINQILSNVIGTMPLSDWLSTGSGLHNIIIGGRNFLNDASAVTDPTMLGNYQEFVFYFSNQLSNNTGINTNINSFYTIY
jgi:hypothetical protein